MLLIKNAAVYSPENKGKNDVLIAAGKIISIASLIEVPESLGVKIVDADGLMLTPGFIDAHVHIAGAVCEGGGDLPACTSGNCR